jgi:polar amino acid transport system substrate-binding protein
MRLAVRRLGLIGVLAGLLLGFTGLVAHPHRAESAEPAQQSDATEVRVAIKPLEPFVVKAADGSYNGFSIELWDEIAKRNGWKTTYVWTETVSDLIDTVKRGDAEAGIAGISMTKTREDQVDFSYPMFDAGLQVMVGKSQRSTWRDSLSRIFSPILFKILGVILLLLVLVGHVIWLFNRHKEDYPTGYVHGVAEGMWIAGETLMTQSTPMNPRRHWSRLITFLWIFASVIFVANITASISSRLTVERIEGQIRGVDDLGNKRVVTVAKTTAAGELKQRGFVTNVQSVDNVVAAYELLDSGKVDAIVYDAPVLQYRAAHSGKGIEKVVGRVFHNEQYGIALPTGSKLQEQINAALLGLRDDGTYETLRTKYFGS